MGRLILTALAGSALAACSAPKARLQVGSVPQDFALEVWIEPSQDRNGALFIVEPDRSIRAAVGHDLSGQVFPPRTRVLTRAEMVQVFNLLAESGILERSEQRSTAVAPMRLYVSAQGRRTSVAVGEEQLRDLQPLVQTLDRLAWVR